MKRHSHRRKLYGSAAFRLAVRFSLLIAGIILILSVVLVLLLRSNVRFRQDRELVSAMDHIASVTAPVVARRLPPARPGLPPERGGHGPDPVFSDLPYYITFTVYRADSGAVVETNDPFLPRLPLTGGRTTRFTRPGYFTDGDLNILYCAKQYGTIIPGAFIVQTALNMDQDTAEKLLSGLPGTLLLVFFPLLLISFAAAFFITKRTIRPVERMTETRNVRQHI